MPDYPKGDWMSSWQADEKIEARARQDWEQGLGPVTSLEEARSRVKGWARRDGWAEKAVAVIGMTRATQVYFDASAALAEEATAPKTAAQLDAEIAEALAKKPRSHATKAGMEGSRGLRVVKARAADIAYGDRSRLIKISADYAIVDDRGRVLATITNEGAGGYRDPASWVVETPGDWSGPPERRPRRIWPAFSTLKAVKTWLATHEQDVLAAQA